MIKIIICPTKKIINSIFGYDVFKTSSSTRQVLASTVTLYATSVYVNVPYPNIIGTAVRQAQNIRLTQIHLQHVDDIRGFNGKQIDRKRSTAMAANTNDDVLFIAAVRNLDNLHNQGMSNVQKLVIKYSSTGRLIKQLIKSLKARVIMK
jgi:hypothetical protein